MIQLGEPIDGGETSVKGGLANARDFRAALSPSEREAVSVWTPGHGFAAAEVPGHEHDAQG